MNSLETLKKKHEDLAAIPFNHRSDQEKAQRNQDMEVIWKEFENYVVGNLKKEYMHSQELFQEKYKRGIGNGGLHIIINENYIRIWEKVVLEAEEKYEELEYKKLQKNILKEDRKYKEFQDGFFKYQKEFLDSEKKFRKEVIQENKNIRNLTIVLSFIGISAVVYYISEAARNYLILSSTAQEAVFFISTLINVGLLGVILFFLTSIDISDVMNGRDFNSFLWKYFLFITLVFLIILTLSNLSSIFNFFIFNNYI